MGEMYCDCNHYTITALIMLLPMHVELVFPNTYLHCNVMQWMLYTVIFSSRARDGRKYVWHGIWSLILLLYAPLVFTCTSLLHCPETPSVRGEEEADVSARECENACIFVCVCVSVYLCVCV